MEHGRLTHGFPKATGADWRRAVEKTLNGAPFETLETALYEGFTAQPLYTRRDEGDAGVGLAAAPCATIYSIRGEANADAVENAARAMASGAHGLHVGFAGNALNWLQKCKDLRDCLEQALSVRPAGQGAADGSVDPQSHAPWIYCDGDLPDIAFFAAALAPGRAGVAGLDPLTGIAFSGEHPVRPETTLEDAAFAAIQIGEDHPRLVPFMASDRAWHGAGGSAVEELGFTLAAAVSYWRAMTKAGMPFAAASAKIAFQLTATSDIFTTISKFRAARLLWNRAAEAAHQDTPAKPLHILAETSPRELTHYDPHVNILRGTAAAFGAMSGGANALSVQPFDLLRGHTPLSRRLAGNTSSILQLESHMRTVADPGRGSFAIETLTAQLCEKAWSVLRQVESHGGLLAALQSGFVRERLEAVANKRAERMAKREDKITGVSAFPNPSESIQPAPPAWMRNGPDPVPNLRLPAPGRRDRFAAMVNAALEGATRSELKAAAHVPPEPLSCQFKAASRAAEPFERLRLSADRASYRIGVRPPVFIAVAGQLEDAFPHAAWLSAFLASAGLEAAVSQTGFQNTAAMADGFRQSGSPIVCLCGPDAALISIKGAAHGLRKAGARGVYLAGRPSILTALDALDAASLSGLLHEGCNAVAILDGMHRMLRVNDLASGAIDDDDIRDLDDLT